MGAQPPPPLPAASPSGTVEALPSTAGRSWLDKTNPTTGDGIVYYPSGNIAVTVCCMNPGILLTVMSDSKSSQVLVSFNPLGLGCVSHPNGTPWLVVTTDAYTLTDKKGALLERGKFPRSPSAPAIVLEVSDTVVVRFASKSSIVVSFSAADCVREWQCGEALRRTEAPYTAKAVGHAVNGKLELDIAAIRQRQAAVGSLYVPPGPHHVETEHPGVGGLRKSLRKLDTASPLAATVADLRALDARVSSIDTLPRVLYGTARSASAGSLAASAGGGGSGGGTARLPPFPDYGSPELSKTQQRFASSMRSADSLRVAYKAKRAKLPQLRLRDVDSAAIGPGAPADTLCVLCVLADWNPVCSRVEAQLQAAAGALAQEAAARKGSEAARVQLYKVDASEGPLLQERYGFRTVPMLLMFYEGRLVTATNALRTEAQVVEGVLGALAKGRKRELLPEGFRFAAGRDDTALDYIQPHTVLREL